MTRTILLTSAMSAALLTGAAAQELDADETVTDEIIVTGVVRPTTQLESSASVSSIAPAVIERAAPRSTAEAFRSLPGIQVEPSSGDANTNLKVRGMPISSGGSRYVSFQEDGFASLLIGDTAFATADSFIRFDRTVDSVQAIRGGSASTTTFNAPGGIINLISKTGQSQGGTVAITTGLDYDSVRGDFEYGMPLNDVFSVHVGGFYRSGEGVRDANGGTPEEGGQIKATLHGEFDRGSLSVHVKHLDDKVPTYLPIPALYNGSGFDPVGVDLGDGTLFLDTTDFANRVDGVDAVDGDGFEAEMTSIALVGEYDVTDVISASLRHRTAAIEGNFASPFPAGAFNDGEEGAVEIVYFNTQLRDLGNSFTDLSLAGDFDFVTVTGGVEFASQTIEKNWNFNQYYRTLDGLNVTDRDFDLDGDGTDDASSVNGVFYGNPAFGNCCTRAYDFEVDVVSPYVALSGEYDRFTFDASYRDFAYEVEGRFAESAVQGPQDIDGDGQIGDNEVAVNAVGAFRPADYDVDFDAWSVGVNYAIYDDMAVFANYAEGGSISSPDRVTGSIDASGGIANEAAFSETEQLEVGFKFNGDVFDFYATYFLADTTEAREFEVTTQAFRENAYEANGVELEGSMDFGNGFFVRANATFTDAEIVATGDGSNVGNQPRRQADYVFNVQPTYEADRFVVGANIFGTDETFVQDSNLTAFEAYEVVSLFGFVDITDRLRLQADVNNVFDTEGFTEGEGDGFQAGDIVRVRPINGRTASATLSYRF